LILMALCQASPVSAQTPTYFSPPNECFGASGVVPCHIHMQDFGGPIMTGTVQVHSLFYGDWSANPGAVQTLTNFYADLNGSTYLNLMSLYGASTNIQFMGDTFTSAFDGTSLNDNKINQIVQNFANSTVDANNPNAVYVVFTAPNVQVAADVNDCSLHDNTGPLKYDLILGFNAQPNAGCGDTVTNALTGEASHELFETLTDPLVGEATFDSPPLAWSDVNTGEIADPCDQSDFQGVLNGHSYTLQSIFVNNASYAAGGYCSSGLPFAGASSTPEPAAWALMILGFGLSGAALRRQRCNRFPRVSQAAADR
jgi:PEP-CTERM motif